MEKLTIKELAPYLPYGLKYIDKDSGEITTMRSITTEIDLIDMGWGNAHALKEFKPILRPLSDLTKEIEVNGEKFVPINFFHDDSDDIMNAYYSDNHLETIPYNLLKYLFEWHFDVFGLIDKGLAVDLNNYKS